MTQNQDIDPIYDESAVQIIDNGCPIHNETEILVNNVGHDVRFQSRIFEIADTFSQAWIICQVRFCDNDSCLVPDDCDTVRSLHHRNKRSVIRSGASRSKRAAHAEMKGKIDDIYEVRLGPYFQKSYLSGDITDAGFNQDTKQGLVPLVWVGMRGFILTVSVGPGPAGSGVVRPVLGRVKP